MGKVILAFIFIHYYFIGLGQFQYTITSDPDSVMVMVNNKEECYTPCRVKYYWKQAENGMMVFSVKSDGYDLWSDTLTEKPVDFDIKKRVVLKQTLPEMEFDSLTALVAFDKVLASFKDGEKVGEHTKLNGETTPIKWEGSIKIGSKSFEKLFYEKLTNMGYRTLITQSSQLFSDDVKKRPDLPRYVVGAQIIEFDVRIVESSDKSYGAGKYVCSTKLKIEWKVLDKSTDVVVLSYVNEGRVKQRTRYAYGVRDQSIDAYEMALLDFISEGQFFELVNTNKSYNPIVEESKRPQLDIKESKIPKFENRSSMIKHVSKSCVTILTDAGHGSGVIISEEGHVITANHVVQGVNKIKVKISEGIELDATLISSDVETDIALLKISGSGFQPLPFDTSEQELGDEVITIGTPAGIELGQSISRGMISGKRVIEDMLHLQVDIAVSPGNSGGPLINDKGEIIGIVQKKVVGTGIEGIGFALPIDLVLKAIKLNVIK